MKDIIKKIRTHLDMNQTEFAERLNVTFATVNRWENDRALPNKLAQDKIYALCKEQDIPVYDMVLEKINGLSTSLKLDENRMILYHGSKSGIEEPILPNSRKHCDFGKGFYMGTDPGQALTLICDYEKSRLYVLSVDLSQLEVLNVPADLDWAMLVAYHRGRMEKIKNTVLYNKYRNMAHHKDVVVGSIADDRMFYVIDNFFEGNITDIALLKSLSALELGKQYVAITQKGCDAVKIEKEVTFSYLERLCIKDTAERNRHRGVSFANDICKNYRREGFYFDELLDNEENDHG